MRKTLRLALAVAALCLPATAAASTPLQIRHVDVSGFPLVRVTAVVPAGSRPALFEGTAPAEFAQAHQLGAEEAIVLAVDNSYSMRGEPLNEATRECYKFGGKECVIRAWACDAKG